MENRPLVKFIQTYIRDSSSVFSISLVFREKKLNKNKIFHYIDKSFLVENRPLVKFIQTYIRDSSSVFSLSSQVRISMTSFPLLHCCLCKTILVFITKKENTRRLEDMNFVFSW